MIHAKDIIEVYRELLSRFKAEVSNGELLDRSFTVYTDYPDADGKALLWYNSPDHSTHCVSDTFTVDNKNIPDNFSM